MNGGFPPLHRFLSGLRRRWRMGVMVRGGLAAAAGVGGIVLLLAFLAGAQLLPPGTRPVLRWMPVVAGVLALASGVLRAFFPPTPDRLALRAEARFPELEHLPRTLLTLPDRHPLRSLLQQRLEGALPAAQAAPVLPLPEGRWVLAPLLILLLGGLATAPAGGPWAAWKAWGGSASLEGQTALERPERAEGTFGSGPEARPLLDGVTYRVVPPAYTGLPAVEGEVGEGIEALSGSRVELGRDGDARLPRIRVVQAGGGSRLPEVADAGGAGWSVAWTLAPEDRGAELLLDPEPGEREGESRIIPLQVILDGPPEVELLEPARDLVLGSGSGQVRFRARARDRFGVAAFHLDWVHTRGSGESFDFREGEWRWTAVAEEPGVWEGERMVELEELGLGPGDVLHVRAVARDRNPVTGPGTGVSVTRQLRVIREGEEMEVDALVGFPVEAEQDPILTQRMVLLLTLDLLERAPNLPDEEVSRESSRIAREQARVRTQLGDQIFSRATGGMEAVVMGPDARPAPDAPGAEGAVTGRPGPTAASPPAGSRYGVASLFDPSAQARGGDDDGHRHGADPDQAHGDEPPHGHEDDHDHEHGHDPAHLHDHEAGHGHDHGEGIPLDLGAGTLIGAHQVGGPGEMPVGFGRLEELGHDHDGDPILSVNRPLLEIYNEMWDSERFLLALEPRASVPHQERAVAGLQEMRENQRVFPRGLVRAPPVDVDGVRGSGDVEDARPEARSPGPGSGEAVEGRAARVEALLQRLESGSGTTVGGEIHLFAVELLTDPELSPDLASLGVRASDRFREGDLPGARSRLLELRNRLDPFPSRGTERDPGIPASAFQASWTQERDPGDPADPPPTSAEAAPPFVFATLRYRSGNWDSAPLVPQNLIHSLAQYTGLSVAPEGIVVDLESPEIFRHPVLYLTGHLPVRFSDAEARNLRTYVERGGFVFMDDHNHDIDGAFHRTATAELARIFGDDALQPLPNDHELYRTFFHFPDGPPTTGHELSGWGDGLIHPELHAVEVEGRIGILYSNKDYSSEWSYHAVNKRFLAVDNTRFGVNILLYALSR